MKTSRAADCLHKHRDFPLERNVVCFLSPYKRSICRCPFSRVFTLPHDTPLSLDQYRTWYSTLFFERKTSQGLRSDFVFQESTQLSDAQRELAQMINGSGQQLLALINDILDYSKVSQLPQDKRQQTESLHYMLHLHLSSVARFKPLHNLVLVSLATFNWTFVLRL